jgi:hypothetical protein
VNNLPGVDLRLSGFNLLPECKKRKVCKEKEIIKEIMNQIKEGQRKYYCVT